MPWCRFGDADSVVENGAVSIVRKIVVAPDSFKGTATAAQVAQAIADGWHSQLPGDSVLMRPMADGGEGTIDAFAEGFPSAQVVSVNVTGPSGRPTEAAYLLLPDGTAVVELASTSGLGLLSALAPMTAHTRGFGQAIAAALDDGAQRLVLAVGGSSSTDGGAGVLTELGARFLNAEGVSIENGGSGLAALATVDLDGLRPLPPLGALVLADVTNPLLGELGAAAVFGPQKGADAEQAKELDQNLKRYAELLGVDPTIAGSGAAGGAAYGLMAWGASLRSGAETVSELADLSAALRGASLLIAGEGSFDGQSMGGKVISHLLSLAARWDVPVALIAGRIAAETSGFVEVRSLTELAGRDAAMAEPLRWVHEAASQLAMALTSDHAAPLASPDDQAPI